MFWDSKNITRLANTLWQLSKALWIVVHSIFIHYNIIQVQYINEYRFYKVVISSKSLYSCHSCRLHPWYQASQEGSYTQLTPSSWVFDPGLVLMTRWPIVSDTTLSWCRSNPRPTPQVQVLSLGTPLKNWVSNKMTHSYAKAAQHPAPQTSLVTVCCYIYTWRDCPMDLWCSFKCIVIVYRESTYNGTNPELGPITGPLDLAFECSNTWATGKSALPAPSPFQVTEVMRGERTSTIWSKLFIDRFNGSVLEHQ